MIANIFAKVFIGLLVIILTTWITAVSANQEEKKPENEAKEMISETSSASACLVNEAVLEDFKKTRDLNEQKAKELADKEADLKIREQMISDELKKIEEVRDSISKTKEERKKADALKVTKLVETFLTMSPKSAAKILGTLDDGLAVSVVSQMETARLAKIMNLMDPVRSSKLSEIMAGVSSTRNEKRNE